MDWDYLLSLSPEDISEEEKDELYNSVTWFSCDSEDLDLKKCVKLIRICQEILKYKGEQVEVLLHKLDELATQKGEEEIRKIDSDTDARSSRSRKSSSLEFENLEQKYLELKNKYKKQVRTNEKNVGDINKLQKRVANLEQEKNRLISELQLAGQEDTHSDVSETVKEQHKELVIAVHNKNKQISDLLRDIESVENENTILRDKLACVRDDLAVATKELTLLTENLRASKIEVDESSENIKRLSAENENLQEEIKEILEQKGHFEREMEEFTAEVNLRVDEWKKIMEEKEKEINELRSRQMQSSHHSSLSSLPLDNEQSQVPVLNRVLAERENQLMEVKAQLQEAVKEMKIATALIQELKSEKRENEQKIADLQESLKELKKQSKAARERCQNLQEDLTNAEKLIADKDNDVQEIMDRLNEKGHTDLSEIIEQNRKLKGQNRMHEKQITNLVKATNKLQDSCDHYEKENQALRDKLEISSDEVVDTSAVSAKRKQQRKELSSLRKTVLKLEEDKVQLEMELHKQKRRNDQVEQETDTHRSREEDTSSTDQIKALFEENEALRKGLHEIMDSLNTRKEASLKEIKSETFEKLLRALDVKHVSGWYHPAMRLQAELHNQEGVNSELREQLRLARLESQSVRTTSERSGDVVDSSLANTISPADLATIYSIHEALQELFLKMDQESANNDKIETKLLTYKDSFEQIRQQINLLYHEYTSEKQSLIDKMSEYEERIMDLEESNAVKEKKISVLTKEISGEETLVSKALELAEENVILFRKCSFVENETKRLTDQVTVLQNDLTKMEEACSKKIHKLSRDNKTLSASIGVLNSQLESAIDPNDYSELRSNFESLTMKYRDLLTHFGQIGTDKELQVKLLEEVRKNVQEEKAELERKVLSLCEKLHSCKCANGSESSSENLAKKLALSERNEISERQRANHTNNLYELVKEQLQKCEEKCKQTDKYNTEVLQKNLVLQEQLKDAENKLINLVENVTYKQLQSKYNELLQTNEKLTTDVSELREEIVLLKKSSKATVERNIEREQELLSLKHQIVDLQAVSDEKMQIARLGSDLSHSRSQEEEYKRKIDNLTQELQLSNSKLESLTSEMQQKLLETAEKEREYRKKLSLLRELMLKSKLQYLGCVPLPSEEKFVNNIKQAISDKHEAFLNLYNSQIIVNNSSVLKEQYERELRRLEEALKLNSSDLESVNEVLASYEDKKDTYFSEIKYRRQCALKKTQLQYVFDRVKIQDEQIIKLEEELFTLHKNFAFDLEPDTSAHPPPVMKIEKPAKPEPAPRKINKSRETQTDSVQEEIVQDSDFGGLRAELMNLNNEIATKDQIIQQLKSKITDHEMNISLFRKQLGDKQSQITFYERHIVELQSKKEGQGATENIDLSRNEEVLALKCSLKTFQDSLKQKEEDILKYQSLLKEDRDKHSMAASLMRDELKVLQKCLAEEKQKVAEMKSSANNVHPSKAALEQYFLQVHSLEDELSELRTKVSSLESQLQASRQEAVRWRVLANDRLESMQKLGKDLEELHRNEIAAYKGEAEKWREEVTNLKQMISKYRSELGHGFDFQRLIKEKDDRIHELSVMLRQAKNESKKNNEKSDYDSLTKVNELESTKEQLLKEHEAIKKRFDQLLVRERSAREEIRDLKGKLLKKPVSSARSDKSERSVKEQLQKKINSLENEITELKGNLDFDRWNKQKHYQQLSEKLKSKLKTKEADFEKLQETCAGYRILIERLEREKYNLENKIRSMRTGAAQHTNSEIEMLKLENMKLISENETLVSKLEMQHHHSGGLGAAMLQEKLEAQERKIAILELAAKGTVEVRAELERQQNAISSLQKSNLCLEAENLDLKLDLEKSAKELPHLREQVQHLENYIEILKKENVEKADSGVFANSKNESKKISELERTIFVLKRVVEKLQAENKRLLTGKRFYSDRAGSGDKLKRDHQRLKEQYCESIQKVAELNEQIKSLKSARNESTVDGVADELARVKEQLEQKTQLLNKVKVLLQRAAIKEKALLEELEELKGQTHKNNATKE